MFYIGLAVWADDDGVALLGEDHREGMLTAFGLTCFIGSVVGTLWGVYRWIIVLRRPVQKP